MGPHPSLVIPGPGKVDISWPAGTTVIPLRKAPSGHLVVVADAYDQLAKAGGVPAQGLHLHAAVNPSVDTAVAPSAQTPVTQPHPICMSCGGGVTAGGSMPASCTRCHDYRDKRYPPFEDPDVAAIAANVQDMGFNSPQAMSDTIGMEVDNTPDSKTSPKTLWRGQYTPPLPLSSASSSSLSPPQCSQATLQFGPTQQMALQQADPASSSA